MNVKAINVLSELIDTLKERGDITSIGETEVTYFKNSHSDPLLTIRMTISLPSEKRIDRENSK